MSNMNFSEVFPPSTGERFVPVGVKSLSDASLPLMLPTGGLSGGIISHVWHGLSRYWHYSIYLLLVCQIVTIIWKYWWKAPSNIPIVAYPTPFGRWLMAWHMMVDSEAILQNAYDKFNGKPFAIPMTDRWVVFISDREKLRQLDSEPESILSMEEALHEHQVAPERKGPKSESFRVVVGVLKNKLRSNIPAMSNAFRERIGEAIALEVTPLHDKQNPDFNEWQKVKLMPALLRIFTRVNLLAFFGEEGAKDVEVYETVMGFFWSCASAFPILNLMPDVIMPLISPMAMGWGVTRRRVFDLLTKLTRQVRDSGSLDDAKKELKGNMVQWAAEMSRLSDAAETAKITLGLLFASAFQIPMIAQSCLYNLCMYPEYHTKLISEAEESKTVPFTSSNQEMPHFDSFLKETARLSPGPILTSPRTVMQPYTSVDGYHVPTGNWLAVPQTAIMHDDAVWPRGRQFEGFRFVDEQEGVSETRFTHPSYEFPFWGSIQHACPARFYVSVIMKMVLAHLLLEYEFKLADPTARPFITFGKVRLPSPFMTLLVRRRVSRNGDANGHNDDEMSSSNM